MKKWKEEREGTVTIHLPLNLRVTKTKIFKKKVAWKWIDSRIRFEVVSRREIKHYHFPYSKLEFSEEPNLFFPLEFWVFCLLLRNYCYIYQCFKKYALEKCLEIREICTPLHHWLYRVNVPAKFKQFIKIAYWILID